VGAARASDSEASLERVVISNIVVDELSSFVCTRVVLICDITTAHDGQDN